MIPKEIVGPRQQYSERYIKCPACHRNIRVGITADLDRAVDKQVKCRCGEKLTVWVWADFRVTTDVRRAK